MVLKGQFLYVRNHFEISIFTAPDSNEPGCTIVVSSDCTATFRDNIVMSGFRSILHLSGTNIFMENSSRMIFENNTGALWGGMLLFKTILKFCEGSNYLLFFHNRGATDFCVETFQTYYFT